MLELYGKKTVKLYVSYVQVMFVRFSTKAIENDVTFNQKELSAGHLVVFLVLLVCHTGFLPHCSCEASSF